MNQILTSQELLESAAASYENHQFQETIQRCEAVLEREPVNLSALRLESRAYIDLGEANVAARTYDKALASDPENPILFFEKSRLLLSAADPLGALEALQCAVELDPDNTAYRAQHVIVLRRAGRREEALAACEEMLTRQITPLTRWLGQKSEILREMGEFDRAFAVVSEAPSAFPASDWTRWADALRSAGNVSEALRYYGKAVELDPAYAAAWRGLGASLSLINDLDGALAALDHATESDPEDALCWVDKGNVHFDKKRFSEARECYETALRIEPQNLYALTNIGVIHDQHNQFAEAMTYQKRALHADPNFLPAVLSLGWDYFATDQFADALDTYAHALKLQPDSFPALNNRGLILFQQNKFEEAIESYDLAMKSPGCGQDRYTWINKARALRTLRRYEECESCLREALVDANTRDRVDALTVLGALLMEILQRPAEAHECFVEAHRLAKDNPQTKGNLAESLLRNGQYPEAREYALASISGYGEVPLTSIFRFMVFASWLLENEFDQLPAAFAEFLKPLQKFPPSALKGAWDFTNFSWMASQQKDPFARFLLTTLVDMLTGKLPLSSFTCFELASPEPSAAAASAAR